MFFTQLTKNLTLYSDLSIKKIKTHETFPPRNFFKTLSIEGRSKTELSENMCVEMKVCSI